MSYITVVIKGDRHQAAKSMSSAGVPFAFHRETMHGETIGLVGDVHTETVQAAYHTTDGQSPQPAGAVLCWSTGSISHKGLELARKVRYRRGN